MQRRLKKISLKTGINLIVIIFTITSVSLTSLIVNNMAKEKLVNTSIRKNAYITEAIAHNLDLYLSNAMETVDTAAAFSSEAKGDEEYIKNEIFRIYDNFSYFDLIFFMDKDGKILFSKPTNTEVTDVSIYTHRDYYEYVKTNKSSTSSSLFMSTILNMPHIILASPVFNGDEWVGLIGAGIPTKNIENIISKTNTNKSELVWVTDHTGLVIINPERPNTKIEFLKEDNFILADGSVKNYREFLNTKTEETLFRDRNDTRYVSSMRTLDTFGWMIIVEQTADTMQLEATVFGDQIVNTTLLILAVAVIFGVFFTTLITNPMQRLLEYSERIGEGEYKMPYYDNIFIEVEELSTAFYDMADKIDKKIQDIKLANSEIENLRQRLLDILENLIIGIIVCDNNGNINFINNKTKEITKYSDDEIIGNTILDFYEKIDIDSKSLGIAGKDIKHLSQVDIEIKNKDGNIVPILINSTRLQNSKGQSDGILVTIDDKSEIKFLEKEIMREDRMRVLGELSATIIHDIGNPLAGISNLIEVMRNKKLDREDEEEALDIIQSEVSDLNKMVRDFLDYTKNKGADKEVVNLRELISEIIFLFRIEARRKNIALEYEFDENDIYLYINRMEVKQALTNIIKNSIHAVEKDGIVKIVASKKDGKINITISDDGVGIKEEDLNRIFDLFFTTKNSGTGLGLPVAYKSIKANGGYISVGSKEGKGTNFIITFLE